MELPSESSGSCREAMAMHEQLPSFATGFKADASSSFGDLYNAYKTPEEKQKDVSYPDASTVAVPIVNEKAFSNDFEKESQKEFDDQGDVAEFPTKNKVTEECAMISTVFL